MPQVRLDQAKAKMNASGDSRAVREAETTYSPPLVDRTLYTVNFEGPDDQQHPQNWPLRKKLLNFGVLAWTSLIPAFASSIFSAVLEAIEDQFQVGTEVCTLGISLFVLGFAAGPIIWAPLSETKGRRVPLLIGMFGFSVFEIAVAVAKDLQTILICRFFAGFFGACPLAVVAAAYSDMFNSKSRGLAMTAFAMTMFSGPLLAPFIGGFITMSYLGWRWTQYIVAIMGFSAFVLDCLYLSETYPPVVLVSKAQKIRQQTGNWAIHAEKEQASLDMGVLIMTTFLRPIRMLFTEPIVFLVSIYMAFIYGLLYLFLTAYPIVFEEIHGFNIGIGTLPYLGMVVGTLLAGIYICLTQTHYNKSLAANNNVAIPEWRLPPVVIGAIAFSAGLFWFGWSGYTSNIHWIVPTASGLLTGFGLLAIFLQCLNYLVDSYLMYAASVMAANTFLRSLFGAGFPLFAAQMFHGMGVQWAGTLLGCVAAVLILIPILFLRFGKRIRMRSNFCPGDRF